MRAATALPSRSAIASAAGTPIRISTTRCRSRRSTSYAMQRTPGAVPIESIAPVGSSGVTSGNAERAPLSSASVDGTPARRTSTLNSSKIVPPAEVRIVTLASAEPARRRVSCSPGGAEACTTPVLAPSASKASTLASVSPERTSASSTSRAGAGNVTTVSKPHSMPLCAPTSRTVVLGVGRPVASRAWTRNRPAARGFGPRPASSSPSAIRSRST